MATQQEATKAATIDEVVAQLYEKLPDETAVVLDCFVREYYRGMAPEDLAGHTVLDLYGAAVALWNFAGTRRKGEALVRVLSPRLEDHGWRSPHTVVEIVSEDMPFLVDSVAMELNRQGLTLHLIVHPVLAVRRDDEGRLLEVLPAADPSGDPHCECFIHVEVDRQGDPAVLQQMEDDLVRVLGDVRAAVEDWPRMRERARQIVAEYEEHPPPVDKAELEEAQEFLRWVEDGHFTFLGYRKYDLLPDDTLREVRDSGLGILHREDGDTPAPSMAEPSAEVRSLARARTVLYLTKANSRSTVHRPSYLDYIGVKRFDGAGEVIGEWRFLGLYTSVVYHSSPAEIPVVRRRLSGVLERAGFPPGSHNEKALLDALETFPRDELFQISTDELFETAMGILNVQERQRVRLFVRRDIFGRFLSCLVYVPRDRYNTEVRKSIGAILTSAFDGTVADFTARISESVLARLHFIVRADVSDLPGLDVAELEARIVAASRSWRDDLQAALVETLGEEEGNALFGRYGDAFPAAYKADFPAVNAVHDIARLESLGPEGDLQMALYHPVEAPAGFLRFKLFWLGQPPTLSDVLPVLENMGLKVVDERPYEIRPVGREPVWVDDFGLQHGADGRLEAANLKEIFQDAFACVWKEETDNDAFNRLVLGARLTWREAGLLRAYCKYLRQAGVTFSQAYMEQTVTANPEVARLLVNLFHARLDPALPRDPAVVKGTVSEIEAALDGIANLDEDRILRSFLTVTLATLRTNYFQRTGEGLRKPYLALKLDPSAIPLLPEPRPMFEVFVHSPRVEAVHLRGARVARGGIRWSDRLEDFRTEVLGLMKAQMVKNAVIVPQGAKGGFVVKRPPADRDALRDEVVACYSTFMHGLLDLTDNYAGEEVIPPRDVVCHDDPDPYLVVAADKGTATFSDLANSIAAEYGFWLGDAFASGGSAGYDHKEMGITARGAWESVRRHFREMSVDVQAEDFTAIGIGDMSGDVFGNGMLLSRHIKLIGAFNHLHVFLDPQPDPELSFEERSRLFHLPRSTWADYDATKLSPGGGIYPRTAKSIPVSPEVRRALAIEDTRLAPAELIKAMLRAPVDLLWNGGIGTYLKATTETHADVGDRATDAVRIDAPELRARVVGEGGNLGFTQRGRIEYALGGGRINTDFIDNSAGVDTSDHEVNIKILLDAVVAAGDLTEKQRNELLAEMTDDVAALVLADNYRQAQAISVTEATAPASLDRHARHMRNLERMGRLNRALEFLPNDEEITERLAAGKGLSRPELAVLLAYSKINVYSALLDSDVPEDPYLGAELCRYLPELLRERYEKQMQSHRLRREIIATSISNGLVNRVGSSFVHWLRTESGTSITDVARAYTVVRDVFDLERLWLDVEALDHVVHAHVQTAVLIESRKLVERASVWLLRSRRQPLDVAGEVAHFTPGVRALAAGLQELMVGGDAEAMGGRVQRLEKQGVPAELAARIGALAPMSAALDIVEVASGAGREVPEVAAVYFTLGSRLELDWLRSEVTAMPVATHWQALAKASLRDDLAIQHRGLAAGVLRAGQAGGAEELVEAWLEDNATRVRRCLSTFTDLRAAGTLDIAMLSVAMRELRNLVQTGSADRRSSDARSAAADGEALAPAEIGQ
jgi:glutamate dehydrogenase